MKNYVKNGLKVLFDYSISLLLFLIFVFIFLVITGEKSGQWLPVYSIFMFLFTFGFIYSDMKKLAAKEKRPQYDLNPYPLKGLVYGAIGVLPVALLEVLSVLILFGDKTVDHIKHLAVNTLMGPLFFIIKFMGEKPTGYILATLVIPLIAMLGYLAGHYGFALGKGFKKASIQPAERPFTKSPWNPTNRVGGAKAKKKKPKTTGMTNNT